MTFSTFTIPPTPYDAVHPAMCLFYASGKFIERCMTKRHIHRLLKTASL